jgi:NAD(P)H-hydrate repair Nnr-like enzyme with NAD(P)H-hydrate dehydratase domain
VHEAHHPDETVGVVVGEVHPVTEGALKYASGAAPAGSEAVQVASQMATEFATYDESVIGRNCETSATEVKMPSIYTFWPTYGAYTEDAVAQALAATLAQVAKTLEGLVA